MRWWNAAAITATAGLCPLIGGAQNPAPWQIKIAKGGSWTVDQKLEVDRKTQTGGGSMANMPGAPKETKTAVKLLVEMEYADEGVEDDANGLQVRRTYKKLRTLRGKNAKPHKLEGCVLLVKTDLGGAVSATAEKGAPGDEVLSSFLQGPWDPVRLLLPEKEVKAGDTYELETGRITTFYRLIAHGAEAGEEGEGNAYMEGMVEQAARMRAIVAKVRTLDAKAAEISFSLGPVPAAVQGMPKVTSDLKATLKFDVAAQRPISLEWAEKHDMKQEGAAMPGMPGMTMGGAGASSSLALRRTYKNAK